MIVKLIIGIVLLVFTVFFVGFNLDNRCDVNLLFYTFKNLPVFYTILISFVLGVFVTIPAFLLSLKKDKKILKTIRENSNKKNKTQKPFSFSKNSKKSAETPKKAEQKPAEEQKTPSDSAPKDSVSKEDSAQNDTPQES